MTMSRRLVLSCALSSLAGAAAAQSRGEVLGLRLMLFVFDDQPGSELLQRQIGLLDATQLGDMDVELVKVVGDGPVEIGGEPGPSAAALRSDYDVGKGFALRLVDRDGGIRLASTTPITMDELKERVDGMLMR